MEAYSDFAEVYDELMDDTPYEAWCEFLMGVFQRYGVDDVSKRRTAGRRPQSRWIKTSGRSATPSSILAVGQVRLQNFWRVEDMT